MSATAPEPLLRTRKMPIALQWLESWQGFQFNLNLEYSDISNKSAASFDAWATQIDRLASLPNAYCKLSGMPQTFAQHGWQTSDFVPYIHHALKAFGARRVNFAGNWFVLDEQKWGYSKGTYRRMFNAVRGALVQLNTTRADMVDIFSGTATRLYRLQ